MIEKINLENILFLDIETVPQSGDWNSLSETDQNLWDKKTKIQRKEDFTAEEFYKERAIKFEKETIIFQLFNSVFVLFHKSIPASVTFFANCFSRIEKMTNRSC